MTAYEVMEVERAGAEIRLGTRVGEHVAAAELLAGFDAVFLAMGLGKGRRLGVPGEGLEGVIDALALLEPVVTGEPDGMALGSRVGVIGGGSTALDAAAAAVQLGAEEVTVFYRRSEAEAPAYPHAIELARSLGVRFQWLAAPVEISGTDGRVSGATFDRMQLGAPDKSGRPAPHRVPGARFTVKLDAVVVATGQEAVERLIDEFSVGARGGRVAVDPATGRTDNPRVWAGGDLVNGGREVVNAVEEGKVAAGSIAEALGVAPAAARPVISAVPTPERAPGVSLATELAGIKSPNPFWLACAPPTNTGEMVARAFEAGWGGAVWKTVGEPITNVSSRLGSHVVGGRRMVGISNVELISDRPIETNLAEIREVKRRFPDRAVVVSLMVESKPEAWHDIVKRVNDTGADGIELNCGCPHGMAERGMGSAVGQVPEYLEMITGWAKEASEVPVLVKLTPNITDITVAARAAQQGGADGVALINTISSLVGLDLDTWETRPSIRGRGSHGGFSGPAVKPIALNMVSAIAKDPRVTIPISGIGGIETWQDAVEFLLVGATQRPGLHRRHALRLPDRRRHDRRAGRLPRGEGPHLAGRPRREGPAADRRLGRARPLLRGEGPDRRGDVHPLQPLLPGLRGRRPPGHSVGADERSLHADDRRHGVRRLPPLRARLPGRRLHLDGRGGAAGAGRRPRLRGLRERAGGAVGRRVAGRSVGGRPVRHPAR